MSSRRASRWHWGVPAGVFAAWLAHSPASAQDAYGAQAKVQRPIASTNPEDPSASGTTLELEQRVMLPRSLSDVLREAPGAKVTNTGGLGAYATVSLRGAGDEETQVLLGEIPLLTPDGGAFDLSVFPAELFERVEVYRGGSPVWLGSSAIGGVIRLVPYSARQTRARAKAGAGSFREFYLEGAAEVRERAALGSRSSVIARGTQGNFPYTDDKGTPYVPDDEERRIKNAEYADVNGYQDLVLELPTGKLHVVALGSERTGGFPGPASQPSPKVRRSNQRALLGLSFEHERGRRGSARYRRLQLVGTGAYGRDRFTDIYGQLGIPHQSLTNDRTFQGFLRLAASLGLPLGFEATLVASYTGDSYDPHDAYAFPQRQQSTRHTLAAAIELAYRIKVRGVRFELLPSARLMWSEAELHSTRFYTEPMAYRREILVPLFRVGAVLEPVRGVAFSASASSGTRLPSMFELFGDRGLTLASPELKPVRSQSLDGGITARRQLGMVQAVLEARAFLQERKDLIAAVRTSQFQVSHENIPSVHQRGAETGLTLQVGDQVGLYGSFTWLDTEMGNGNRLPFRPRYVSYLRPEGRLQFSGSRVSGASLGAELWYRSFSFVDRANLPSVERCFKVALIGAVDMFRQRVRVGARIDDVADARCSDLVGYPLPGRSVFFSISYQESRDAS